MLLITILLHDVHSESLNDTSIRVHILYNEYEYICIISIRRAIHSFFHVFVNYTFVYVHKF